MEGFGPMLCVSMVWDITPCKFKCKNKKYSYSFTWFKYIYIYMILYGYVKQFKHMTM